jgi:MFS family permease
MQSAIFAIGSGTYLTGSVVFFTIYVGLSPVQIGIGLSVAGLIALVTSLPIGHLADRLGGRRTWIAGAVAGGAAFALYPLTTGFWTFIAVLTLEATAEVVANAGRAVYTAAALPKEIRVRAMAFNRAYLNVGFTVGSGLGAGAIALDSRTGLLLLVLANAAGMLVNAAFVARMPAVAKTGVQHRASPWGVLRDHPYTALATVLGVVGLNGTIFGDLIPLWAITMTDVPKPLLGALFALNTVMAVTLQVIATRGADSMTGSTRLLRRAALAMALACPVIALSGATHGPVTIAVLAVGVVLTTATELWTSAAQWYFQTEIPPAEQRGAYIGASRSVFGVLQMAGPASLTFLAIRTGGWGWWVIAALFAACAAAVRPVVGWVARTPRNGAAVAQLP